ncbi:C-C chemokine receptor-like 2 [Nycticebus coucang]|uniref:C-C chemokine receptor-like 2 n=1 Tax=Nycticebus coucang TaxID=9470 RepID=UPI00234C57D0|nr:C-C chemokine receptor-like 2 [Nycticebus coucang]XP_053456426.1 C-C chemokine receptor-like 2 [Nycticebus coucang]XP_053456427.1 C-C chemokine receptor-like 2 [Nycticebus coucang]XP_053456428.1 C-C chemokine receptor-like 2 [Nycticebus coucang]XP_053456429.1 C-C chemokine receptor-like 2 [Nycticebus coucang]XP_053456430.1 C-C chemokine receptor-like 2 [Nycticebus coucang]XP_053456431.1 C-C chemokine receptor-like 2 [Nycticebus coucang]XP_053456432.1 C-C chemokine receptor-like 2 [Nyctice
MANYTEAPEDDYDVFITDDPKDGKARQCDKYEAQVLSAQLVPHLYSLVSLVGLLGNILLVLILVKCKGLKHVENIYFLNLALSNLCFLLTLPFWAYAASHGGSIGEPICTIVIGLCAIGLYGEALFSTLLIVQRYLVFVQVRRFCWTTKTVPCSIITSVLAWVIVILITLPECVFYKPQMDGQVYKCTFSRLPLLLLDETSWKHIQTLKMNILVVVFPLLILLFLYVRMRKTLRVRERHRDLFKLVFAIVVVFLLMWAPYNVALFLSAFKENFSLHDCESSYSLDRSVQITRIIATTHCCVNPLLCVFLDKEFRKNLGHLFHLRISAALQPNEASAQGPSGDDSGQSTQL